MPTRKEILEELGITMEEFSEELGDYSSRHSYSAEQIERAAEMYGVSAERLAERLNEHANSISESSNAMADSSKRVETSIGNIGTEITTGLVGGVIAGGAIATLGVGLGFVVKKAKEKFNHLYAKEDLIASIVGLEARYGRLTYDRAVDRTHVKGLTRSQRQDLLNELLHERIAIEDLSAGEEFVSIDRDGDPLKAFRMRLENVRKGLDEMGET